MLVTRGYEDPVLMPSMDVYDTSLSKAYISGVKQQYEQELQEAKDFLTKYQDFVTPIIKDLDYWYNNTIGGAKDMIKLMQANGIDPFRSPEARAAISNYIYSRPYDKLNNIKQSAETAKNFLKVKADLLSRGLWNPEYEKYMMNGATLENWDTTNDGVWLYMSPGEYKDLHSFTDEWFKHLKPTFKGKKNGYLWYGIDDNDLNAVISGKIPDIINDGGLGQFFYQQALNDTGGNEVQARKLLKQRIASRNHDYTVMTPEIDQYNLESIKHQHAIELANLRNNGRNGRGTSTKEPKKEISQYNNLYQLGIANIFGYSQEYAFSDPNVISQMQKDIYKQQKNNIYSNLTRDGKSFNRDAFFAKQTIKGDPTMLKRAGERELSNYAVGGSHNVNEASSYYLSTDDMKKLEAKGSLFTKLAGQGSTWSTKDTDEAMAKIKQFKNPIIEHSDDYVTVLTKTGRVKVFNKVRVYNTTGAASGNSRVTSGEPVTVYYDTGITSKSNGPKGQYLTVSKDFPDYDRTQPFTISDASRQYYDAANARASAKFGNKPGYVVDDMFNYIPTYNSESGSMTVDDLIDLYEQNNQ